MAATGGGKIRSRRYHIASKPYAKSKQQSGLINRVTDTVKSIVPSWLQKYFKGGDAAEEGGATQGSEEDNPVLPPNGGEEGPPPLDGWDSPEPSTSHTEPSTSKASLNLQDNVLSRPPLTRSHHLHFPPLEASSPLLGPPSSLFSPPSTSSAPGPFTTGFSLVKEIKDNLSQHEDDNISTTSGFSSRASDKDVPASKMVSAPRLWSPESERTHSGAHASQASLKKPAFNLSVFGTSSNSTLNSTVLNSSQLGDSPFYPGKTTYGGAAAARSLRTRPSTPYQAPVRRQIKAKPAGAQPCGVTSGTARRILQSLERMSSPLADAKRIPSAASSPMSVSMDGTNLDLSHSLAKKKRLEPALPPVQKMVVPTAAAVSGNRSVSFRPSLTPGGVGRFLDRTFRDTSTIQSPHLPDASPGPSQSTTNCSSPAYPLSSTPAASSSAAGGGGKMKRERTSTRPSSKRPEDDEAAEAPDLPAISLPISTFSLPTFSFSTPPLTTSVTPKARPSATPTPPAKETVADKEPSAASTPPCLPFTFSSPIVKATAATPPSFSPSAGFTFSAPVAKMGSSMSNGKLATPIEAAVKSTTSNNSTEEFDGPFKPAKTLKQGSVLDLLKSPGFASPVTTTSPSANSAPRPSSAVSTAPFSSPSLSTTTSSSSSSSSSSGFGSMFKPPAGSWSCDVCLVQNKQSDAKCVACGSQLPKSAAASTTTTSSSPFSSASSSFKPLNSTTAENNKTAAKAPAGFGAMFARPAGMWDCDTCLVQNKAEAVKCVACDTAKPGTGVRASLTLPSAFAPAAAAVEPPAGPPPAALPSFGDMFKKPEGTWQCDTCMVDNKPQDTKCVACMTSKPGSSAPPPAAASAPVAGGGPMLGFGDMFKKPEGAWDCAVCCVQNKAAASQCVACETAKPGAAATEPKGFSSSFGSSGASFGTSGTGAFKFGTTSASDSTSGAGGFKFGAPSSSSSSSATGGFKFGVTSGNAASDAASNKDTSGSSGFKFGGAAEGFKFGAADPPAATADSKPSDSGFKFGDNSGALFGAGTSGAEAKTAGMAFSFGVSKPEEKAAGAAAAATTSAPSVTFTVPTSSQESSGASSSSSSASTTTTTDTTSLKPAGSVFGRLGGPITNASPSPTPLGGGGGSSAAAFGAAAVAIPAEKDAAAPTFSFGKPEEKTEPASFLFGAAGKGGDATMMSPPADMGGFTFNAAPAATAAKEQAPPPAYPFGKPADKSEAPAAETPKPAFSFGRQSAADPSAAPLKPFSFNAAPATSAAPAPSLFGSGVSQAPAAAASPAPSAFMFGQASAAPAAAAAAAPAPAPAQPFLFGAPAGTAPPAAAAAAATGFPFGEVAPSHGLSAAPTATSSPFVFSSAPSSGFGASQAPAPGAFGATQAPPAFGSAFGSPAPSPFSAPAAKTPAFGAKPSAAPVFGQQANAAPVFGGPPNPTQPGFQFGGATAFGASANNAGVFAFGGGAPPALAAAPSAAPQQTAPGVGFTFSQPPTFNMGSNKTFTASPAGPAPIPGRKIKTAVRRRK